MTMWKSLNVAIGALAFAISALLGLLMQLVWMVRLQQPANQLSVLVLIAPIPLLCWWSYLAGLRVRPESLRRVLLPAAVSVVVALLTVGFWTASVGWRWTAGAGLLATVSEVIRVAALGDQLERELVGR